VGYNSVYLDRIYRIFSINNDTCTGNNRCGIYDHFADLGGKSINAVSIIAKMESRYHMKIHSYNLAENPNIAQLAAYLDKHPIPVQGTKAKRAKFFRG